MMQGYFVSLTEMFSLQFSTLHSSQNLVCDAICSDKYGFDGLHDVLSEIEILLNQSEAGHFETPRIGYH